MARNYAEQLVETLEKQGVEHIYGLVGDSLNPIVDAVRRSSIEWIHVRNEEAAAFAAEADSLTTGKLAVCAASCGPGNTHLIQGLYDANRNGAKVLALASHIPSRQIGSHFFQETHPEQIFQECSGYCEMVMSGDQGGVVLHHAIQSTMAGNGVSVLVIPGDVSTEEVDDDTFVESKISTGRPVVYPDPAEAAALTQAINEAESVAFFVGAGAKNAREQVLQLAEKVKAPIGHALGGKMYIQYDNPFDVGMSGLLGYGAAHEATHEADLLILLGTDFPYNDFLPKGNVAQVDINGSHIGRRTKISYPVTGDVAATIENILPHVEEKKDRSFLDKMLKKHYDKLEHVVEAYTSNVEKHTPIHPEYVADLIDRNADEDAIFTVDTGMCNVWAARYLTPNGKRRVIGSFLHGSMANALPHAIGVGAYRPDRPVIAMCGDGGLSMLMGDLITIKNYNLLVKVVVFNNSSLGMVKLEMLVAGLPDFATDSQAVDYAAVGKALGIRSVRVEDPTKLESVFTTEMERPGPCVIDVVTDPNALSMPPKITLGQMQGFATAMSKQVLGGGLGEVMSMARSNLRNIPKRPSQFTLRS